MNGYIVSTHYCSWLTSRIRHSVCFSSCHGYLEKQPLFVQGSTQVHHWTFRGSPADKNNKIFMEMDTIKATAGSRVLSDVEPQSRLDGTNATSRRPEETRQLLSCC